MVPVGECWCRCCWCCRGRFRQEHAADGVGVGVVVNGLEGDQGRELRGRRALDGRRERVQVIGDVQLAAGAEVEAVDAGAQVGAVRLHALHREHAHADLVGAPRLARQLTQRPAALVHACNNKKKKKHKTVNNMLYGN